MGNKIQSQIKPERRDCHNEFSTETHNPETEPNTLESSSSEEIETVASDIETNKETKSCDHSGQSLDSGKDDEIESKNDQRRKARAERRQNPKARAGGGTNNSPAPTNK